MTVINKICKQEDSSELEIKSFFDTYKKNFNLKNNILEINIDDLKEFNPTLLDNLISKPKQYLDFFKEESIQRFNTPDFSFFNLENEIDISKIRVKNEGELRNVKGIIKRVTKVLQRTVNIRYECASCGTTIKVGQFYKKIKEPKKCSCGRKMGFKKFSEEKIDIQEINLEEMPDKLDGKQSKQIRVYLEESLTEPNFSNKLQPGKKIEVIGIIEEMPPFMNIKDEETNVSEFMIKAFNINSLEQEEDILITDEDLNEITEFSQIDPLKKLANSLIPEVYGNQKIKEAIVLQLVKGVAKKRSDGSFTRSDIHILLSGDPGTAKSITLESVNKKTPKSHMVVGTKTSRVGLGAMAVKDELTNTWALECGALVLSSGSLLCIDELDKMYKEHLSDLLEPMSSSCYDDKTEILTENGWKLFSNLEKGEKVAILDGEILKFVKPTRYFKQKYKGNMVKIKSQKIDLVVTPNHNIYSQLHKWGRDWKPYDFRQAKDIYGKQQRFKKTAKWEGKKESYFILPSIKKRLNHTKKTIKVPSLKIDMNLWVEFLGYYLSEGSFNMVNGGDIPYHVRISQAKKKNVVKKIDKCLKKIGFNYSYNGANFIICNKQLATYLSQFGRAREKFVPQYIKELNKKQISKFLEALMLGDGCTMMVGLNKKSISRDYITSSQKLANDVQELLLKIGIYGHISSRMPKGNKIDGRLIKPNGKVYNVHWIINKNNNKCTAKKQHFSLEYYKGYIYCVEVPTHILYVRRNGIPIWCGNSVTINKAGISAKLSAYTSILASANPIQGNFNLLEPLAKQLDLPSPIINRFDLIFILLDRPDKDFDKSSVEHIFHSYQETQEPEIKTDFFKKYIFYCKKLRPKLKDELLNELQEFYSSLRQKSMSNSEKGLPINLRNMEGLIRLSEAHAKLRLSEYVEKQDFEAAKSIFLYCLKQVGTDLETGLIDTSRLSEKVPLSKRGKLEKLMDILEDLENKVGKLIPIEELLKESSELNIKNWEFNSFIEQLEKEGKIFKPKKDCISLFN